MAAPHRHIKRGSAPLKDWKNGRGKSAEIAIHPPGSSVDEKFLWRLSSAQVSESGPFSEYPGYDRFLTLLEGGKLALRFEKSGEKKTLTPGEVLQFSGDEVVSGEILSGTVTDLNLIVRRKDARADFSTLKIKGKPRSFSITGKCGFLFLISGQLTANVYPGEHGFKLKSGDALHIDCVAGGGKGEEHLLLLEPGDVECQVALIELDW